MDLSLKLASAELVEVSWLIFMEESDTETSDDRVDLEDDNSDRDVDMAGDSIGSGPYSAKYGCARAWLAEILFLGSNESIFSNRSLASDPISGSISEKHLGRDVAKFSLKIEESSGHSSSEGVPRTPKILES